MGKKMKAYQRDDGNTTRLAVLETVTQQISQTLIRLEQKIDDGFTENKEELKNIRQEIKDAKLESKEECNILRSELSAIRSENTGHFRTTIFALLTLVGAPLMTKSIEYINHFFA
jgi:hypothetical protein